MFSLGAPVYSIYDLVHNLTILSLVTIFKFKRLCFAKSAPRGMEVARNAAKS